MSFKRGDKVKIVSSGTTEGRERVDLNKHVGLIGEVIETSDEISTVRFADGPRRVNNSVLQSANAIEPQPVPTEEKSANEKREEKK
jgi:hypothetical protein